MGALPAEVPPYTGNQWLTLQFSRSLKPSSTPFVARRGACRCGAQAAAAIGLAIALAAAGALVVGLQALAIYTIIEFDSRPHRPSSSSGRRVWSGLAPLPRRDEPASRAAEDAPAARRRELERPPRRCEAILVRGPTRSDHEPFDVLGHRTAVGDEQHGASQPSIPGGVEVRVGRDVEGDRRIGGDSLGEEAERLEVPVAALRLDEPPSRPLRRAILREQGEPAGRGTKYATATASVTVARASTSMPAV